MQVLGVMDAVEALRTWFESQGRVIVAYSGGVDSAFLADVAHEILGNRATAITAVSPSLAPRERLAASQLASQRGWRHYEVETDEHTRPEYIANDVNRCYHCKDALFDVLDAISADSGETVCVGTNLDDLGSHRPGLRAVAEHQVAQPLVTAGFSKAMIREQASLRGLPVADKPATPCLASRVAYGVEVTPEKLGRVARAEELVWALGVSDVRVRDLGGKARVDVPVEEVGLLTSSNVLAEIVQLGFEEAVANPDGLRSGSLLKLIDP